MACALAMGMLLVFGACSTPTPSAQAPDSETPSAAQARAAVYDSALVVPAVDQGDSAAAKALAESLAHAAQLHQQMQRRIDDLQRRLEQLASQVNATCDALVQSQRKLYRATPEDQRGTLLVDWLGRPQRVTRQLALTLAEQRLAADSQSQFDETMLGALRQRLDDPSPGIQSGAVLLLRRLRNEPAADMVADRLVADGTLNRQVTRAYLLMMERLVRAKAVEPALAMLDDPELATEAAGVLAEAIRQNLLTAQQEAQAAGLLRRQLFDHAVPHPQMVALLARVADQSDWRRIEQWLDSPDAKAKYAAATAWAESDRPLLPLARRSGDESIGPIVIAAATRRGRSPATMLNLVNRPPTDVQMLLDWRRALLSMAGRVSIETLIEVDRKLVDRRHNDDLRQKLLSAGIGRLQEQTDANGESANGVQSLRPPLSSRQERMLVDLLLRRADIWLSSLQPKAALADFLRVGKLDDQVLDASRRRQLDLGQLHAQLALDDIAASAVLARELVAAALPQQVTLVKILVAEPFLMIAERNIAAGSADRAGQLLKTLSSILGPEIPLRVQNSVSDLQQQISALAGGSTDPTP